MEVPGILFVMIVVAAGGQAVEIPFPRLVLLLEGAEGVASIDESRTR